MPSFRAVVPPPVACRHTADCLKIAHRRGDPGCGGPAPGGAGANSDLIATAIVCDSPHPAQPNRLELGALIAHLIRANHADAVLAAPQRMDQGPGTRDGIGLAMGN